jgi:hypothetical protein
MKQALFFAISGEKSPRNARKRAKQRKKAKKNLK